MSLVGGRFHQQGLEKKRKMNNKEGESEKKGDKKRLGMTKREKKYKDIMK